MRLRNLAEINPVSRRFDDLPSDAAVSFLPMEGVWPHALELDERIKSDVEVGYTRFEEGDLLVPKISPTFGHARSAIAAGLLDGVGAGTTELHVLRARPRVSSRWLFYVTKCATFLQEGESTLYGVAGQKRVSLEWLRNYHVDAGDYDEQVEVASSLDRLLRRIDSLIAEEEALREFVIDRREAEVDRVIEHGGLSAGLAPVDSLWVDAIPRGWRLMRLKWCVDKVTVGIVVNPSHYYEEDGVPVLRGLNIRRGRVINQEDLVYMSTASNEFHAKSRLEQGDVVVVRTGAAGAAALVPEWAVGGNIVDLLLVRPGARMRPRFLELVLNSRLVQRQITYGSVGALQAHFNTTSLSNVLVVVPNLSEQDRVVTYLSEHLERYDRLITEADHAVALLRERRQALITSAVASGISGLSAGDA